MAYGGRIDFLSAVFGEVGEVRRSAQRLIKPDWKAKAEKNMPQDASASTIVTIQMPLTAGVRSRD